MVIGWLSPLPPPSLRRARAGSYSFSACKEGPHSPQCIEIRERSCVFQDNKKESRHLGLTQRKERVPAVSLRVGCVRRRWGETPCDHGLEYLNIAVIFPSSLSSDFDGIVFVFYL